LLFSRPSLTSLSISTVVSGDYCAKIEAAFSITMVQLQSWNPNLLSDCSNLQLGDAYCVQGPTASAGKRAVAAMATSSTKCSATAAVQNLARILPMGMSEMAGA
jgi:hypothetical protein